MNILQLKDKLINDGTKWVDFNEEIFKNYKLDKGVIKSLIDIGLPDELDSGLFFSTNLFNSDNIPEHIDKLFCCIGSTADGDVIAIKIETSELVILNHEDETDITGNLLNTSLDGLYKSMVAHQNYIYTCLEKYGDEFYDGEYTQEDIDKLEENFKNADSSFNKKDNWWKSVLTLVEEECCEDD